MMRATTLSCEARLLVGLGSGNVDAGGKLALSSWFDVIDRFVITPSSFSNRFFFAPGGMVWWGGGGRGRAARGAGAVPEIPRDRPGPARAHRILDDVLAREEHGVAARRNAGELD